LQNLTVNGTFTGGTATTLAAVKTLTVNGTLFADAATLAAIDATDDITGTGTLVIGSAMDPTKVKFVIESALKGANIGSAAITDDDLVIPADTYRYFTGKAAPSAKVTVNGMLGVSGTGSLTIAAGAELANAGTIALTETGSVVLTGAASTGGAKLTGTGKLTAGKTEIVGGTSGWQAVSSASTTITIASSATEDTATITASANTVVLTAQGAGATITQLAGAGNALTIAAATTVDVSAAGSLILKGAASNGAKVTLAADTAIIKGAGTTGSVTTANITKIGDVAIDNLTVGTNTVFTDNGSGNAFFTITGGSGGAGSIEAKADLTLDKDTTLTYS
jgi:hypothetical protein